MRISSVEEAARIVFTKWFDDYTPKQVEEAVQEFMAEVREFDAVAVPLRAETRKALYMREYMRNKRAKERTGAH